MITVAGEALVDIIVDTDGHVSSVVGGAPLNTARTASRLGVRAAFLGGVSTDAFGNRIMRLLAADGVELALGRQVSEPTTLAIASLDASGAATYRFLLEGTSAAALTPELALAHLQDDCRILHVGTLGLVLEPLADASVALVGAVGDDVLVMVDPNCRPSVMAGSSTFAHALDAALERADVVKVSADDLHFLDPDRPPIEAARALQGRTGGVILFTDGGNAVHVLTLDGLATVPVPAVPVVDTVGAGDSFSGGFLAHWTSRNLGRAELADADEVLTATRFGILVAGITCQRAGADPPRTDELPDGAW